MTRCPTHGIPDCSPLLNGCSWKPSEGRYQLREDGRPVFPGIAVTVAADDLRVLVAMALACDKAHGGMSVLDQPDRDAAERVRLACNAATSGSASLQTPVVQP